MIFGRYFARRRALRDHAAFEKVLKHACLSRRFRDTPASQIGALEALNLWYSDRIEPPSVWDTIEQTPIEPSRLRWTRESAERYAGAVGAEVAPGTPEGYELPEQTDLLSAAMGVTAPGRPNA